MQLNHIHIGDNREVLKTFPDKSVNCCITSPPYFGLRDYGHERQIGLEETPEQFVAQMVAVFREVRRVLRDDGVLWLNLGDSYAGGGSIEGNRPQRDMSGGFSGKDKGTRGRQGYSSASGSGKKSNVPNIPNFIHRKFESGIFFFGNTNPITSPSERIDVLIYDKSAPDLVFFRLLGIKKVSIKQGNDYFGQIGNCLNPPINCVIGVSSGFLFGAPGNADVKVLLDSIKDLRIVVSASDLNTNAPFASAAPFSEKNSKASFSIKIPGKPIPEGIANLETAGDSVCFNLSPEGIVNVDIINQPVSFSNTLSGRTCQFSDFFITNPGVEKVDFIGKFGGIDISVLCVRHLNCILNVGIIPYTQIYEQAKQYANENAPKQELGIPEMVKRALMRDGWICRQTIIWHKPNPMPESVTDRCTKAHEYIFLLSKSERYWYDAEAIAEKSIDNGRAKEFGRKDAKAYGLEKLSGNMQPGVKYTTKETRNRRSVWTVPTAPYSEAHFATYPPDLIRPCVLAGCPEGGVVLDPFFGSGTTGQVALEYGRKFVGIELNPDYARLAERRIRPALTQHQLFTPENLESR